VANQYVKAYKRYRTPVLAVLATVMLVCSAVWSFDVPWRDIAQYFLLCVLGVAFIALLAAALVFVMKKIQG
jgi:dolichyl-phosphate-mannose--protein O-mannosyl transferase|tara:strand:- start:2041 stop:2253 length:213 start_codon:yes stop_codon:yes gene_type:complete